MDSTQAMRITDLVSYHTISIFFRVTKFAKMGVNMLTFLLISVIQKSKILITS